MKFIKIMLFSLVIIVSVCPVFALDNGYELGDEFQVNTYTTSNQMYPSVASNGTNYFVTWESEGQDGNGYGVFGQLFDSAGNMIGIEFQINTYMTSQQIRPSVASDGTNYLVTWQSGFQEGNNGTFGIFGQLFDNAGNVIGSEFHVNSYVAHDQTHPSAASNGTNYLVTWSSRLQDGYYWGIYGQLFDNIGTKIGSEFQVSTYTINRQYISSVASDGTNYLVTWMSNGQDGNGYGVFGQLFDNTGTKIGTEFQVNTYTTSDQYYPSVASDSTNYLVTWQSDGQDGSNYGIYGQLIDNTGTKIGTEFHVNSYVAHDQTHPSAASNGTNYLVTWQSSEQDGSNFGVYAKIITYPLIFGQPLSKTVYAGENASFTVGAVGIGELHYQWYKNSIMVGTDSDTLILTDVQLSDNDSTIYCVVSDNINDPITSAEALLTVLAPIIFIQQPQSQSTYVNEPVSFSISADTEVGGLHYQWYKNSVSIGSDSNELVIQDPQLSDNDATIYCDVSNYCSTVRSDSVTLTVLDPLFEIIVYGAESMEENDTALYTAHARYGSDEYIVTYYAVWSILEPDNCAEFIAPGVLKTYPIDYDKAIIIRATLMDGGETHWGDFSVLIDNLFQVVGMNPIPDEIITHAPYQIVITFSEDVDNDTVNDNTCRIVKAGDDKEFDTSDDSLIPLFPSLLDSLHLSLDISDTLLPNDIYRVKLSGINNADGNSLDGEFSGLFPSGDDSSGGDFSADFTVSRQITLILLDNEGTDIIEWASFRDNLVYKVESTNSLEFPDWQPLEPVSQWPISETICAWDIPDNDTQMFFRVVGVMPHIDTVTPSFGTKGVFSLSVDIVGYGTEWSQEDITVSFGDGITVDSIDVNDSSHVTVAIRISFGTDIGYRDIIITNGSNFYIKENGFEVVE